jgi:hypothetical protein
MRMGFYNVVGRRIHRIVENVSDLPGVVGDENVCLLESVYERMALTGRKVTHTRAPGPIDSQPWLGENRRGYSLSSPGLAAKLNEARLFRRREVRSLLRAGIDHLPQGLATISIESELLFGSGFRRF